MSDEAASEIKEKVKSPYSKRYPTDCRDKTPNTIHMLNDKNIDVKLYSIFQQYSYAVEIIDEDTGKRIGTETRVNKENFPSKKRLCSLLGEQRILEDGTVIIAPKSPHTVRKYWNYLFNPSEENKYCPYIIEKDEYYILPERESKFSLIPIQTVNYLNQFCSQDEIKAFLFFYSMDNWFKHTKEEKRKSMPPSKLTLDTKDKDYFVFTLKDVACNIGVNVSYWDTRPDLWAFDLKKVEIDPTYQLGFIPKLLIGLKQKGLIDYATTRGNLGHNLYLLTKVNLDIHKILKSKEVEITDKVKENRVISEDTISEHGITPPESKSHAGEPGHISNGMDELLAKLKANAQKNN